MFTVSDSGYTNDILSIEYVKHFAKHATRSPQYAWQLLVCDGYESHSTKSIIRICNQECTILCILPAHTSHFLQPLGVSVFHMLKHYHSEAIDEATRTGCYDYNKLEFLAALPRAREQAFRSETFKAGFWKTQLWPCQPDIVLQKLFDRHRKLKAQLLGDEEEILDHLSQGSHSDEDDFIR